MGIEGFDENDTLKIPIVGGGSGKIDERRTASK
jgi:hypothetical protein